MKALVLSGAGAGLFAHGGALRALTELGWRPDYVTGASAGAIAATLYAAGEDPVLAEFAHTLSARDLWGGDGPAPRLRRAIRLLSEGALLDASRLRDLIRRHIGPEQLAAIENGGVQLEVPAYDVTSAVLLWWPGDLGAGLEPLRDAVLGSAALPGALPPVRTRCALGQARELVDAGIVANHPIRRAAVRVAGTADAEVLVVSALHPPALGPLRGVFDLADRVISAFMDRAASADMESASQLGVRVRWIYLPGSLISLLDFTPEDAQRVFDCGYRAVSDHFHRLA